MKSMHISRREFLKATAVGLGSFYLHPISGLLSVVKASVLPEFPQAERLGRILDGKVLLKARPDVDSSDVGELYEDDIVTWLREVVGSRPLWNNQRFVETPDGYIYAPNLQPVRNLPNKAVGELTTPEGMWTETL